jgi:hypothetical protein
MRARHGDRDVDNLRTSDVPDANWLTRRLPEIRERFSQWLAM